MRKVSEFYLFCTHVSPEQLNDLLKSMYHDIENPEKYLLGFPIAQHCHLKNLNEPTYDVPFTLK